jgi:hypothetical protein
MAGVSDGTFVLSASDYVSGLSASRYRFVGPVNFTNSWFLLNGSNTTRYGIAWAELTLPTAIFNTIGSYSLILETISTLNSGMTATVNFDVTPVSPYGTGIVYRTYQL